MMTQIKHNKKKSFFVYIAWFLIASLSTYEFFLRTFPGTLHETLVQQLHLSIAMFGLLGSAFYFTYGLFQIPFGILIDRYGARPLLLFACIFCSIGAFLFIYSTSPQQAIIARFLIGFGSAPIFIGLLEVTRALIPQKWQGFFIGNTQLVAALGGIFAARPLIYFVYDLGISWKTVVTTIAAVALFLIPVIAVCLNRKRYIFKNRQDHGSIINVTIKTLYYAISHKQIRYIMLYAFFIFSAIPVLGAVWGVTFLENEGLSLDHASLMVSITWVGLVISCPIFGLLNDLTKKTYHMLFFIAALGVVTTVLLVFLSKLSLATYLLLFLLIAFTNAGQCLSFVALLRHCDHQFYGTLTGLNNTCVILNGAIIPATIGIVVTLLRHFTIKYYAIKFSFLVLPIAFSCAMILALILLKIEKNDVK